jgi:two-component system OmpR family response regulator
MLTFRNQLAPVASKSIPSHILVVDDDPAICAILREGLEAEGFSVLEAGDKASLFHILETESIKLITLDLSLCEVEGLGVAREIRAKRNVPIVMVTARGDPIDRVMGLEHGADDYISKPFHIREVVMRIRSVLRRYETEMGAPESSPASGAARAQGYAFDHGILDIPKREARKVDGTLIELTEMEFRLLEMFVKHPARVLSREEISQALKGQAWSPLDRTIDGHVARLRRKVEPLGEAPMLIKSVRGLGYVFTGEVRPT